jgi:hypothetical protein
LKDDSEVDDDQDKLLEEICENGDLVFSIAWNSGNPGSGADCYIAYCWNDRYAVACDGLYGPYDSLDAALKENDALLMVTPATESIDCDSMSGEEVATMLWCESDEPLVITINGEEWKFGSGAGFQRVTP